MNHFFLGFDYNNDTNNFYFQSLSLFDRYIFSYIPGGTTGLKFFSKLFASAFTRTVGKTLPI